MRQAQQANQVAEGRDRDRERQEDDFDRLLTSACIAEEDYCIVDEG